MAGSKRWKNVSLFVPFVNIERLLVVG